MIHNILGRQSRFSMACLSVLIAGVLIPLSAVAQSDSNPRWDAFIGYQYQQADGDNVPTPGSNPSNPGAYQYPDMAKGIGGALTYNFNRYWGLETDFGYSRNTDQAASEWTASAGPRFIIRTDSYSFLHPCYARIQSSQLRSGTVTHDGLGAVLGGGMDIPLTKMFSWRVFQVDYVWAKHNFSNLAGPEFSTLRRPDVRRRETAHRHRDQLWWRGGGGSDGCLFGATERSAGGRTDHRHGHPQQFQS